jgi:hypothetical protein
MESSDPRLGKRIIVYPDFLEKAGLVLAIENILGLQSTWHPDCRPEIYAAEDHRILSYMTQEYLAECMDDAKAIAVAGYKQALEDG